MTETLSIREAVSIVVEQVTDHQLHDTRFCQISICPQRILRYTSAKITNGFTEDMMSRLSGSTQVQV